MYARQATKGRALVLSVAPISPIRTGFLQDVGVLSFKYRYTKNNIKFGTKFGAMHVHLFGTQCIGFVTDHGEQFCGLVGGGFCHTA